MKKITLIAMSCITLGACDTINSISMPSMDMFRRNTATTQDGTSLENIAAKAESQIQSTTNTPPSPTPSTSALETELNEMEMLTGTRLQVASVAVPSPVEPVMPQTDFAPTPPVPEAEIRTEATLPTQIPTLPVAPVEDIQGIVEVQQEPTPPAPEPVAEPVSELAIVEPAVEPTPKIVEPMAADATPIFTENDLKLSSAAGCPQIQIMPAARSITYFMDNTSDQITARASIDEIRGGCEIVSGGMEIDLDILMKGKITNKGRFEGNVNEEAFMTFPYFVSTFTPQGLPVDKQILATAMRFRPSVDYLDHAEKITQFIPMDNTATAANYTITIGYQLTRKQLDYNRAIAASRPNDQRASPDTIPARRLSVNPLAE